MTIKVLVVNPNSTEGMTESIQTNIQNSIVNFDQIKPVTLTYFTGPDAAPPQIENIETSLQSMQACFPILNDRNSKFYYQNYDGVLVCCFSDHPLVFALSKQNKIDNHNTTICGLLDTSINYCNMLNHKPFSIITSNEEWVSILNKSVKEKFLTNNVINDNLWKGTVSTNLQVLDLHDPSNLEQIISRIQTENVTKLKSKVVILGCAGFSGLKNELTVAFNNKITFIEPVTLGLKLLLLMVESHLNL